MPYQNHIRDAGQQPSAGEAVDPLAPRYGVVVRDIFNDAGWTEVEPVRARDWHDAATGDAPRYSETSFD